MGAPSTTTRAHNNPSSSHDEPASSVADDDGLHKPPVPLDDNNNATGASASAPTTAAAAAQAYLALIQQYLSVFMIDNATFLAERCVAEYPDCSQAAYLQALCYYRAGNPKTARHILERHHGRATVASYSSSFGGSTYHPNLPEHYQENNNINISNSSTNHETSLLPLVDAAALDSRWHATTTASSMQYLAAQCSYELKEYSRAEDALLQQTRVTYKQLHHHATHTNNSSATAVASSMDEWILTTSPCPVPNGAAGLALLGNIYRKSSRKERAIKYFKMSLQLDPFLWTSFEALVEMGDPTVDSAAVFGMPAPSRASSSALHNIEYDNPFSSVNTKTPLQPKATPVAPLTMPSGGGGTTMSRPPTSAARAHSNNLTAFETPGLTPIPVRNKNNASFSFHQRGTAETPVVAGSLSFAANTDHLSVVRRARQVASRQYYPPSPDTPVTNVTRSMRYLHGLGGSGHGTSNNDSRHHHAGNSNMGVNSAATEARSLFLTTENKKASSNTQSRIAHSSSSIAAVTASNAVGHGVVTTTTTTTTTHPQEKPEQAVADAFNLVKPEKSQAAASAAAFDEKIQGILKVLGVAGMAFQQLCRYKCREALVTFQTLPPHHQTTAWVLHQQGRAYLELNDFQSAQRCLEYMHKLEPGRMKGLEMLSTVYWQMKKEVELASLAQRVVDWDRTAPQAWCVVGNCFSLQKDHESALIFFQRSLQLDPDFTYTHTLSGYEYMANEDFDKAMACFRQALRTDDRHYNAWYGLGGIYHRQEKFDLAEYHFERACSIHPASSILRCNLGIAQYANGKAYQALETLSEASRLDPRNPQARFQRATIYSALHRPEEALAELEKVLDAAPREATVHFAMGKVLKRLGKSDQAMKCFLAAMDLDPKDSQMIKSAMDKLDAPDDEETMTTF